MLHRGFTLIELLVVISIIGLMSTIAVVSLTSSRIKARDVRRIADFRQMAQALELYFDANGYYPSVPCGWDCNGYAYSYDSTWDTLGAALAPYMAKLPKDPINSNCPPWSANCYSYSYGNVGRMTYPPSYELVALLEDPNNSLRCGVQNYAHIFPVGNWCGPYSTQIYVRHP